MNLMWTDQLSVGNAILDSDHKELLRLVRDIDCVTKARDHSSLPRLLKLFKACMNRHFLNEELLAHALDIPFAKHQHEHRNMQVELDFTTNEMENNSLVTIYVMENYPQLLRDWLIKHIAEEDKLMKPALQTRPYGFMIDGVCL